MTRSFQFFSLLILSLGIFLTACNDDNMLPDPDPVVTCDSVGVIINLTVDSTTTNEVVYTLTAQSFDATNPTYLWSTGETTESITVTDAGTYSVTLTDDNDCTAEASIDVNVIDPCAGFAVQLSSGIDSTTNQSTIYASPAGGTAPISYVWNTGETTPSIEPDADGTYEVSLTDANGCIAAGSINYTTPDLCDSLTVFIFADSSELTAAVNGGTAPYSYVWSTGETGGSILPNGFGTYDLTVTDANGCTATTTFNYQSPCANFNVTIFDGQDSTGTGGNNVLLIASVGNGTNPYVYTWSTGETTSEISVQPSGTYGVTVTDANNCEDSDEFEF